jgi:uncharacterized membrane protein
VARVKNRFARRAIVASAVGLTAATIALAAAGVGPHFTQVSGKDAVTISGASLEKGTIRFFSYRDEAGKHIRFILERDESGQVHGALDACQRCAQYGKGYTASHGYLVCRFCGNRYKLNAGGLGPGSCAPVKLAVREANGRIIVNASQLEERQKLF